MKRHLFLLAFMIIGLNAPLLSQSDLTWSTFDLNKKVSLRGISAVSEKECWVSGTQGTVAKTTDGGLTWDYLNAPDSDSLDFRDIEVFTSNEALILSIGNGNKSRIYKTSNGGESWRLVYQNQNPKSFYDSFTFWNEKQGMMQGDPIDGRLELLVTADGGESWTKVPFLSCPKVSEGEYAFAASGSQIASRGNSIWIGTGGSKASVFKSSDFGTSWKTTETKMIQGESSQGIFSIDFMDTQMGIGVGGDYTKGNEGRDNVMFTSDGGETWRVSEDVLDFRSIVKFVGKTIVVAGPSGAEISEDMGVSWQKINGSGFHTLGVDQKSKTVWAAGSDGRIGKLKIK
jgi:photosystem II stability/assembly factor-like uncharacterized protein